MIFLMENRFMRYLLSLLAIFTIATASAQNFPSQQNPPRLVNDFANIFTSNEEKTLERKLVGFSDTTSTQIAVVTVKSLDGIEPSQYATELAHKWGIGVKGKDNGVLILVKPKTSDSKGEVYIAVGYGLEGAIPDVIASRIVRDVMIPNFQQGAIYAGVTAAATDLMHLATGEYTAEGYGKGKSRGLPINLIIVIGIFVISIIQTIVRKRRGGGATYDDGNVIHDPMAPFIFGSMLGRSSRGSGGFDNFGGFGGGGFGGFSGGGFGGGGAGGSW